MANRMTRLLRAAYVLLSLVSRSASSSAPQLGFFLRSMHAANITTLPRPASDGAAKFTHYRLLPARFPSDMHYHFDGLAAVLKFEFGADKLSYTVQFYESSAYENWRECIFFGSGTGPTLGLSPCLRNPAVNLLPIDGQLWLTIDTAFWGRVDPDTLETIAAAKTIVPSTVLNAHPACDPHTHECFVQYPCSKSRNPLTNLACFGLLKTSDKDLHVSTVSHATMPETKLIQHSHSPCLTPNFVVSKLDHFGPRAHNFTHGGGVLKTLHQVEDDLWMLMDRRSNTSRVLRSNVKFVNNHFWNCYEAPDTGAIVVESVAVTGEYLDTYFADHLGQPTNWDRLFQPPQRCVIPTKTAAAAVNCTNMLGGEVADLIFDYPTFNPFWKMRPGYRFFYAISPQSKLSPWFDRIVKVDVRTNSISRTWSSPGIFVSEADFIVPSNPSADEDAGDLVSVLYNQTADTSSVAIFDARDLRLREMYQLNAVVPFHAHGISCVSGRCFTNP